MSICSPLFPFYQVGGIKPGCFKIGNTGGMLDNILASKLYRAGSVAYVSRSGGMSNELNNIISRTTDGVYEGVAIGGDRYMIRLEVRAVSSGKCWCKTISLCIFKWWILASQRHILVWQTFVLVIFFQIPWLHLHGPCPSLSGHTRDQDDSGAWRGGSGST